MIYSFANFLLFVISVVTPFVSASSSLNLLILFMDSVSLSISVLASPLLQSYWQCLSLLYSFLNDPGSVLRLSVFSPLVKEKTCEIWPILLKQHTVHCLIWVVAPHNFSLKGELHRLLGNTVVFDVLLWTVSKFVVVLTFLNGILLALCTAKSSTICSRFNFSAHSFSVYNKISPLNLSSLTLLLTVFKHWAKWMLSSDWQVLLKTAERPQTPHGR